MIKWNNLCTHAHTAAHLCIHRSTLAQPYPRRNQYALCLLRYRLPNNNQWNCTAVPASVWDDVSELSCWRYSRGTEAHTLAVCWQTQVMFWTRPWINIAFRCCCENSHLLQARASEWGFNSCIRGFVTEREKCYIHYHFFYPFFVLKTCYIETEKCWFLFFTRNDDEAALEYWMSVWICFSLVIILILN